MIMLKKQEPIKKQQLPNEVYERVFKDLNDGKLAIDMIGEDEQEYFDDLHLLTNKKFVYAMNVSEEMMDTPEEKLKRNYWSKKCKSRANLFAKLEADMIEMTEGERKEF